MPRAAGDPPWRVRLAPSIPECVAIALAVATPLVFGHTWVSVDGDPARHIRVGETILRSGLFYSDPFSFTRPGAAFVPYEWLSEVLFALSVRSAGLPGMFVLTGAVLGLTYAIVARTLLRRGVSTILTAVTVLFAMAIGSFHWQARPHVFTFLGTAVLMSLIATAGDETDRSSASAIRSVIWPVGVLFAVWANLHGGFLYGIVILATTVVGDRLDMLAAAADDRRLRREALVRHAAMLAAALGASLLTPSGVHLYSHTIGYLRDTYLINSTVEYLSPDFHHEMFPLIAIVLVVVGLPLLPKRPPYSTIALVTVTLALALLSRRNLPLFGIVALPLLAIELQSTLEAWGGHMGRARWLRPVVPGWTRLNLSWPAVAIVSMYGLAMVATRSAAKRPADSPAFSILPTTFNPSVFPVAAVREARAAHLTGRIFSEFAWGGYLLYAWPEQHVFVDGQTDFYGDSIVRQYDLIRGVAPGWRRALSQWRIGLALLETDSPLANALAHEQGWQRVYCDSTAVLFLRGADRTPVVDATRTMTAPCALLGD